MSLLVAFRLSSTEANIFFSNVWLDQKEKEEKKESERKAS